MELIQTIYKSFTSPAVYANAAFRWKWKAFFYFLILVAISAFSISFTIARAALEFYENDIVPSIPAIKSVKIENGLIKTPEGKNIELFDKSGRVFALISENYTDANLTKNIPIIAEKDRIAFITPEGREFATSLANIEEKDWEGFLGMMESGAIKSLFVLMSVISAAAMAFAVTAMQAGILSLAAVIISLSSKPRLRYLQCLKISVVAMTPPTVIDAFLTVFMKTLMPSFVFSLISCGLIMFAMASFRRGKAELN